MNIYVDIPQWAIITFNTILGTWCLFNAYLNYQKLQLMKHKAAVEQEARELGLG